MTEAFSEFGLTETQQNKLLGLLQSCGKQLGVLLAESLSMDGKFLEVLQKLEQTYGPAESQKPASKTVSPEQEHKA